MQWSTSDDDVDAAARGLVLGLYLGVAALRLGLDHRSLLADVVDDVIADNDLSEIAQVRLYQLVTVFWPRLRVADDV